MAPQKPESTPKNEAQTNKGKEKAGAKKPENNWLEDLLVLLKMRENIRSVQDAKKVLKQVEKEADGDLKKKKTSVLAEELRKLVVKEDESPVSPTAHRYLQDINIEDSRDLERLGTWMEEWGAEKKDKETQQWGKDIKEKKDKTLLSPKKRKEQIANLQVEQVKEKRELTTKVDELADKFAENNDAEINAIKRELSQAVGEVTKKSTPNTVEELQKTQESIVLWTRRLKNEDWQELLDREQVNDLTPSWVKKLAGDERIETIKRKAVLHELLGGVQSIESLKGLMNKGLSLEDSLKRLNVKDQNNLEALYRRNIYQGLRESDSGLAGLLERVDLVRNPWKGKEYTAHLGEGGRGIAGVEASPRGSQLDRMEKIVETVIGRALPTDGFEETSALDNLLRRNLSDKDPSKVDFQIFNNINYAILPEDIRAFIDDTEWRETRGAAPAYIKREFLTDKTKMDEFMVLWRDRTRLALRKIAYQQSESKLQDPVMAELTTLLSILGVPSSEKGMIRVESQVYGMVDALMRGAGNKETFAKLFSIFEANGVGFRLIDKLKQNRERVYWVKQGVYAGEVGKDVSPLTNDNEEELRMSVFDFMRVMGHRLTAEELTDVGLPAGTKMMWGTAIYRKSVDADIDAIKKLFMKKVLGERGVANAEGKEWFGDVFDFYQDYIDEAVYFKAVQAEIDGIVGNASLENGKYEFPAGLKEYLVGKMSVQGARYFETKYQVGNVHEAVSVLDGGIRSIAVMARYELVNHLIGKSATTEGNLGASEVFFNKVEDSNLKNQLVSQWNKAWEEALFHHGHYNHHDPTTMFTAYGDEGSIDSGLLRPTWNTIDVLKKLRKEGAFLVEYNGKKYDIADYIDYSVFSNIVHDADLSRYLTSTDKTISADSKLSKFFDRFGEDYRSYSGEKSKRWSDWPVKYWISKLDEAFGLLQELSNDPYNVGIQKKLIDLYKSTNAAGVPAYQRKIQEMVEWYAKDVGVFGHFTRYKREIEDDKVTIFFDKKKGIYGDDQEFPGIASEKDGGIRYDVERELKSKDNVVKKVLGVGEVVKRFVVGGFTGDPSLRNNSLSALYGHGQVGEWTMRQMLLERRGAGFYPNKEQFSEEWNKWALGILWNKEKSPLENAWNWITLNAPFEYVGMVYAGVEGHKLREILSENSEKTIEKMMHYLNH